MTKTRFVVLLLVAFGLGLFLRCYALDDYSFWLDEVNTIKLTTGDVPKIFTAKSHTNPPLLYLLLRPWLNLFGDTEVDARAFSILWGVLSIPFLGVLGAYLYDRRTGILAAFLLAVMVFPVHYSREVRPYTLFLFTTIGSFYFFLRVFSKEATKRSICGYVLFTIAMLYTHNYALFTLLAQNLFVVVSYRKQRSTLLRWVLIQSAILLLYIPWLYFLYHKVLNVVNEGFWIPRPRIRSALNTFRTFSMYMLQPWLLWFYVILALFGSIDRKNASVDSENTFSFPHRGTLLLLWVGCPIVLPIMISQFMSPIYWARFTFCVVPAFYMLVARGVLKLNRSLLRNLALVLIAVISAFSLYNYYTATNEKNTSLTPYYYVFPRERWREFNVVFQNQWRKKDAVLFYPDHYVSVYYYYRPSRRIPIFRIHPEETKEEALERWKIVAPRYRRLWVIECASPRKNEEYVLQFLNRNYNKSAANLPLQPVRNGKVFIYGLKTSK